MKKVIHPLIAFFLVWSICSLPLAASAATDTPRPVVDVIYVDANGDVAGLLALVAKGRAIGKKLRPDADVKMKIYIMSKAGPYTGTVAVAVQHTSHAAWADGQQALAANPEWHALIKEFHAAGYKITASILSVELASFN